MKKILVPIDFSEFSINALEVASYVAKVKDLQIRILHVIEDSYTPYYNMVGMNMVEDSSLFNYRKELQENLKVQMEELAQKIRAKEIAVEWDTALGSPYQTILKDAEENDVDLIVLGSHGHNDIEEIFLGGTTEKVIRLAQVPVLTVHEVRENYKIDKIVFASNFEDQEVEPVLERLIGFAEIFMAELFLVRINTSSKVFAGDGRKKLDDLATKFKLSAGAITSYHDRSEEDGIVNYANEVNADLIAMCTHGRTGLARLFRGSVAEEVAGFSQIPVLTFNISRDKIKTYRSAIHNKKIRIDHSDKVKS